MSQLNATRWVNDYGDMLYRFALPRVNNREVAKDLVQDTFLAAWRNHDQFKGEASEKNWLFTILRNKIIDHFRKASNQPTASISGTGSEEPYFDEAEHWSISNAPQEWNVDYNSLIEKKEFYEVLSKCKGKLKDIQNAVFTMKYLEELDSEDICKALNISASNYWVLIHRAKLQLRECLEKNWVVK
jgi:RNA polymerase sigma-70 factor (TIGR02943 family)